MGGREKGKGGGQKQVRKLLDPPSEAGVKRFPSSTH